MHTGRDDFLLKLIPHYPSFPSSGELVQGAGAPVWVPIKLWTANRNAHLRFCEWVHTNRGVDCQPLAISARSHELLDKRQHQSEQPLPAYLCSHTPSCQDITFQHAASGSSAGGCHILTVGGHCLGKSAKPRAVCLPAASSSAASKKDGPWSSETPSFFLRQGRGPVESGGRGCWGSEMHSGACSLVPFLHVHGFDIPWGWAQ